ncbi:MAG: leucine-rich repeat protein [Treponema sp.]|jgi:hypothetical protein|nr:leucine-rich repeat protein [Treponema sp.]
MKSGFLVKAALPVLLLAGCTFLMGPDEPVGENTGTLTVSFGETGGDRAVSSGKDLPAEILAALRYEVRFTGPGGVVVNRRVSGGGTISLSLTQGPWRIDASAYYMEALAGTGSLSFKLNGSASVRVPMYLSGPCYEITIPPTAGGTVASNFSFAFPGTTVTLTVMPEPFYWLKPGTLKYNDGADHPLSGTSFTMPAADVTVAAVFGKGLTSITEVSDYLANAAGTYTAANPLPLPVSIAPLQHSDWAALLGAIAAAGKYVALDLSDSRVAITNYNGDDLYIFDPYQANPTGEDKIVSLVLPGNATHLGLGTIYPPRFMHFTALKEVSGAGITYAGHSVLQDLSALTGIDFPALETIGTSTFSGTALTEVDLPNLTSFDHQSFQSCTSLRVVRLKNITNSSSRSRVFDGCTSLEEAYLPAATRIGSGFFEGCTNLTTVALGGNCDISGSGIPNNFEAYYNGTAKEAGVYRYYGGTWHYEGPYTD